MKKIIPKISCLLMSLVAVAGLAFSTNAFAEDSATDEQKELMAAATSISISPVSKILQLSANSVYEDSFKVTNNGSTPMEFETYASPYSYTFSESDNEYKLGFSNENTYTQITRWITFKDNDGNYVTNPKFTAQPGEGVDVYYRISTPASIPAGGQYAVLFAHTLSSSTTSSGIKTEASPGLVVYGRSTGETITSSEIRDLKLSQSLEVDGKTESIINASAKVKNTGNVDFMASGSLKVQGIFGQVYYETPSTQGRISVIPESELTVSDKWKETPYFGLFNVTWTVSASGHSETISQLVMIMPAPVIIVILLLLTIIIVWIIIIIRKRKERRSRFMV